MSVEPATPPDILEKIRAPLATGARRTDAPILQPLSLLLDLAGEALRARLFIVQSEGGGEACLRPDFTVAVARGHIAGGEPAGRYYYEGAAFRASGGEAEAEEFLQLGVEAFSSAGQDAAVEDARVAAQAWAAAAAGGRIDLTLWLGDVGLFGVFIESLGLADALAARLRRVAGRTRLLQAELARAGGRTEAPAGAGLAAVLSQLSEAAAAAMIEETWALAGVSPVGGRGATEIAQRLVRRARAAKDPALSEGQADAIRAFMGVADAPEAALAAVRGLGGKTATLTAALDAWRARLDELDRAVPGGALRFAPALGHAFDYYDGLTLEVRSAALGDSRPLAVGGRYDSLLARLGAPAGGRAVGCMVRPWRAFVGGAA